MTDRDDQIGAVQCVKVKFVDAIGVQPPALLGGERRGDEAARIGIIVEPVEMRCHPARDRGSAARRHARQLGEICHRQDTRHDRDADAGGIGPVAKPQVKIDIEEELRDRAARAGIELRLQIVEIVAGATRGGMRLGIGGDADLKIGDAFQPGHEIGGVGVPAGVRRVV